MVRYIVTVTVPELLPLAVDVRLQPAWPLRRVALLALLLGDKIASRRARRAAEQVTHDCCETHPSLPPCIWYDSCRSALSCLAFSVPGGTVQDNASGGFPSWRQRSVAQTGRRGSFGRQINGTKQNETIHCMYSTKHDQTRPGQARPFETPRMTCAYRNSRMEERAGRLGERVAG